jgi:hypothetical protein
MEGKEAKKTLKQAQKLRKRIKNFREKLNTMLGAEQLSKRKLVETRIKEWMKNERRNELNKTNESM